jgi:hypothetical protein
VPVLLYLAPTEGSIDEPAKIAGFEFPGGAIISPFRRTFEDFPAAAVTLSRHLLQRQEEK